jgi:sugar lactone lactonase YvrE
MPGMGRRLGTALLIVTGLVAGCGSGKAHYSVTPLLPTGSPFHGIHGLRFDNSGALFATSVIGQSIFRIDTASGAIQRVIAPPEGMADDLAFAADGTMYWTAIEDGILYAKAPSGPIRRVLENRRGINGIAFSPDRKRLFVSLVFYGDALYELDQSGAKEPRLIADNLGGLNAFSVWRDGMIYGPLVFGGKVVKVNPDTGEVTTISTDFKSPGALKIDSKGAAYVLDGATLKRLDLASGSITASMALPFAGDNIAIDSRDHVFVSLMAANAVAEVDIDKTAVRYVTQPSKLTSPAGLAVAVDGGVDTLYVGDLFGSVRRINGATGALLDTPQLELFQPSHVSITGDHLIAVSQVFGTVQQLDRHTLQVLQTWEGFNRPGDAIEMPNGDLIVVNGGTGQVLQVTGPEKADRTVILALLQNPTGLAMGADGAVYVTESGNGRVFRIVPRVTFSSIADGLGQPEGIALDPDGNLIVLEVGAKRLTRIDSKGATVIATGLPIGLSDGPSLFRGVAAGVNGIYFTSDVDNTIYRVAPVSR